MPSLALPRICTFPQISSPVRKGNLVAQLASNPFVNRAHLLLPWVYSFLLGGLVHSIPGSNPIFLVFSRIAPYRRSGRTKSL